MNRKNFLKQTGLMMAGIIATEGGQLPTRWRSEHPLIKPRALRPGDTIGLTAPAGILPDYAEFDRMKNDLESLGFHVVFGEFVNHRHGYFEIGRASCRESVDIALEHR